jgi:guanyl-specific ribonuclease Sa
MRVTPMRAILIAAWFVVVLAGGATPAGAQRATDPQSLPAVAHSLGLREVDAFVEAVQSIRANNNLPPRYVTKDQAKAHGWRGGGLCAAWPGHAIGGDRFHNFGAKLPAEPGRTYREADLDSDCRGRGPKRLVFSNDGRIYVTVDHYNSFVPVP